MPKSSKAALTKAATALLLILYLSAVIASVGKECTFLLDIDMSGVTELMQVYTCCLHPLVLQ